jgi:hypothetical protein
MDAAKQNQGVQGKQGVAAPVSSRLVCQPCFMCQLLHHCVNDSLLLKPGWQRGPPTGSVGSLMLGAGWLNL